jgi:hypothetical protein
MAEVLKNLVDWKYSTWSLEIDFMFDFEQLHCTADKT